MISSAAIVGCGPSGMVIAHACHQMGLPFIIYAPKKPSFISGAQYLHSDIDVRAEGLVPKKVHYQWKGQEWQYEKKIYGRLPNGLETSWSKFPEEVEAWPLVGVYHWLWDQYSYRITGNSVTVEWMTELAADGSVIVFNTAPLNRLFPSGKFWKESVQIVNGICFAPPDTIVYNGEPSSPWYRTSNLWGHMSIEYPEAAKVPSGISQYGLVRVEKPLYATDIEIPGVILSGRYGRWEKGVLVDESYHQAIAEIKSRLHNSE